MPLPRPGSDTPARLSFLSPEIAVSVDPARLRALLSARFAPELARLVARGAAGRSRLTTARALWGRRVPLQVADALDELARLATLRGRDALVEAARDIRWDHAGWEEESPVDLAAKLLTNWIELGAVILRAQLRLARFPVERATYELRATMAARVPDGKTPALAAALRRVVAGEEKRARAWSDAWLQEDEESGDLHGVVLSGAADEGATEVGRSGPGGPVQRRTLRADAFLFRVSEARLAMTLARPQRLDAYAAAWGTALYDDERFFLRGAPSVTLKALQEIRSSQNLGEAPSPFRPGLRDLPPEILRARVVACQLDTGSAHRVEVRGPDALARLAPHLRKGGHLTRATLRFDIVGEVRPVDATLRLPHRVDIGWSGVAGAGARGARIAREALASLGLLQPGLVEDDITTLLPLVHPEWRWRELVGDEGIEAMAAAGVLEEVAPEDSRRPTSPKARHLGGSVIAFRLFRPGFMAGRIDPDAPREEKDLARALNEAIEVFRKHTDYYAVPDDWSQTAFTVRQQDLTALRLSIGALLRNARREMGLERGAPGTRFRPGPGRAGDLPSLPRGVHHVGEMRVEGGTVVFFYLTGAARGDRDRAAIGRAVARAAGFGRAVLLVPKGRKLGRDFVEIELTVAEQLGAASWRGKIAEAVRALGIEDRVAPEVLAPSDARLVVDRRRERVLLDGVPLVKLGESGYRLLRALAERADGVVPTPVTDKAISGARESAGATRNVVWKMRAWVEGSFAEAGKEVAEDVKEAGLVRAVGRKGWTLTVKAAAT